MSSILREKKKTKQENRVGWCARLLGRAGSEMLNWAEMVAIRPRKWRIFSFFVLFSVFYFQLNSLLNLSLNFLFQTKVHNQNPA
jgi:hypothetical protein